MPTAREIFQYQARTAMRDQTTQWALVGIATGGLPSPTGAVGVPSGVTVVTRFSNSQVGVSRVGTGLYNFVFAPAPNGIVRAWVELQSATAPTVVDAQSVKRAVATGWAQVQYYSPSGTACDPANGDALGFEFVGWTTGNAAGP